jgi:transcriptional regulator with XRE-family HTH domain
MADEESIGARVGARLREARLQRGLTVREVAERIGVKHAIIVKYENGVIVPSLVRLHTLAHLYGLTAAALLAEHDAALPLFAMLDQADVEQIERVVQLLRAALRS